ncbi:MAG: hypothetical protein IPL75_16100 [Acidobacteria bacterium]|nr:hypothetical protein [Acidobacteriota bacterium]
MEPRYAGIWVADAVEDAPSGRRHAGLGCGRGQARQRQLSCQLRSALRLVADIPGTVVPAKVLTELDRSPTSWGDLTGTSREDATGGPPVNLWLFWRGWRRARRAHPEPPGSCDSRRALLASTPDASWFHG